MLKMSKILDQGVFVAADWFELRTSRNAKLRIENISRDFDSWFLSGEGKIEQKVERRPLHRYRLLKRSYDQPIVVELGGNTEAETTLWEMCDLLDKQASGEAETLLMDGHTNFLYVCDQMAVLRMVYIYRLDDGIGIGTRPIKNKKIEWAPSNQVFSPSLVSRQSRLLNLVDP